MTLHSRVWQAFFSHIVAAAIGAVGYQGITTYQHHHSAKYLAQIAVGLLNPGYELTPQREAKLRKRFEIPKNVSQKNEIAFHLLLRSYTMGREVDTGAAYYLAFVLGQGKSGVLRRVLLKQHVAAVPWDYGAREMLDRTSAASRSPPQEMNLESSEGSTAAVLPKE